MATCLADFVRGSLLGSGQSGYVYQIMLNGSPAVLKIQDLDKTALREAIFLSSLRHPNIITLLDICILDGQLHLALEQGEESYNQWLEGYHLDSEIEAVNTQIHCAVAFLAQQHIAHNDLHRYNVVMVAGVPKIIDFGFAGFDNSTFSRWEESGSAHDCASGTIVTHPLLRPLDDYPNLLNLEEDEYELARELSMKVSDNLAPTPIVLFVAALALVRLVDTRYHDAEFQFYEQDPVLVLGVMMRILGALNYQIL